MFATGIDISDIREDYAMITICAHVSDIQQGLQMMSTNPDEFHGC